MPTLFVKTGDITEEAVDAIVNAANATLRGGGGVDGAIHRKAGWDLLEECVRLKGCAPGDAKMTRAYRLPCRAVIHTVGPIWKGGAQREAETLASCWRTSLDIALREGFRTVRFPSISTGSYGYPIREAARIAVSTVLAHPFAGEVGIVCFTDEDRAVYQEALEEALREGVGATVKGGAAGAGDPAAAPGALPVDAGDAWARIPTDALLVAYARRFKAAFPAGRFAPDEALLRAALVECLREGKAFDPTNLDKYR